MSSLEENFKKDIENIAQIPIVKTMLDVICQSTGMGFSAIARVTEDRWITCSTRDDIGFGLLPGSELEVKTTICDEIRQSCKAVIIDNVANDPLFHDHHTPAMYGLQSYISVPIIKKDGTFFGTLCAIDPKPHVVSSPQITGMFFLFADLIAFHLEGIESVRETEAKLVMEKAFNKALEKKVSERTQELAQKNAALESANKELESFTYISSHDLQEPLRKIQTIASAIADRESDNLTDKGKDYFRRMQNAAHRMQTLINDLLAYSRTTLDIEKFKETDLDSIAGDMQSQFSEAIAEANGYVNMNPLGKVRAIPFQINQLFENIIGNSIKYAKPGRPLQIDISSTHGPGSTLNNALPADKNYTCIRIADNGIGFDQQYSEKIFSLFKRLHDKSEHEGTGIGLAIVKRITDNHSGLVTASGKPDEGAVFEVFIPTK